MKLYKNCDYKNISEEDLLEYERIRESKCIFPGDKGIRSRGRKNQFPNYPKSVRHYNSLFPNNYLDILELKKEDEIHLMIEAFEELLNSSPNEQKILSFINENENYLIIASIFKHYNFGHHGAYLFKEFPLNTQYRADYLLVGKGSGGYEFIFIELEHPSNNSFKNNGIELSQHYQKGISQVKSWERFLEQQFSSLQAKFNEAKKNGESIPTEFINNDSARRHYVVIAGRREHYEQNADFSYAIRRSEQKSSRIELLHYDNLIDFTENLIGENTY